MFVVLSDVKHTTHNTELALQLKLIFIIKQCADCFLRFEHAVTCSNLVWSKTQDIQFSITRYKEKYKIFIFKRLKTTLFGLSKEI